MAYNRKRYRSLNEGPTLVDFFKNKVNAATSNIVRGAANSATGAINNATSNVKLPPVSVGITADTKKTIFKAIAGLAATGLAIAYISKN